MEEIGYIVSVIGKVICSEQSTPELEEAQGAKLLVQLACIDHKPSCFWVQILNEDSTTYVQVLVRIVYHEAPNHSLVARYYPKKHDQVLTKSSAFLGCPISYDGFDYCDDGVNTSAKCNAGKSTTRGSTFGGKQKDVLSGPWQKHSGSRGCSNRIGRGNKAKDQRSIGGTSMEGSSMGALVGASTIFGGFGVMLVLVPLLAQLMMLKLSKRRRTWVTRLVLCIFK